MEGLTLWISQNVSGFLIGGLLVTAVLAVMAGRAALRGYRRARGGMGSWRRVVLPAVVLVLAGLGLLYFGSGAVVMGPGLLEQHRLVGSPAPDLPYGRVSDGATASLGDHRGKVLLVNLWATWCPPCRHELPELDRLQGAYEDRGLVVLHISDEPRDLLAEFLAASPTRATHGFAAELPLPEAGRPTTFVIDRGGVVRNVLLGPRTFEQFEAEVRQHL